MEPIKRTMHDIYPYISATGRLRGAARGKSILITGGGKGIGKAIAEQFALAGATSIGLVVTAITADIVIETEVAKIFSAMSSVPDILVNNDGDPELWWRDWEVNLKALYLVTRAYLKARNESRPGAIINLSSSVADIVSPTMSSYGTSKTAVNRFTEVVQLEYGKKGIRCLAFHPGSIASTGMGQNAPEQFRHRLIDTVELAAGTALYLSTSEAGYLDGRFVYANWDFEKVEKLKDEIVAENLLVSRINYGSILSPDVEGLPPP